MILLFVVGASVTGYAASQYLEFRNSKGAVVLNTAKTPTETDASKTYTSTYERWNEEVKRRLQPGEYAAYYVKDDSMNQKTYLIRPSLRTNRLNFQVSTAYKMKSSGLRLLYSTTLLTYRMAISLNLDTSIQSLHILE